VQRLFVAATALLSTFSNEINQRVFTGDQQRNDMFAAGLVTDVAGTNNIEAITIHRYTQELLHKQMEHPSRTTDHGVFVYGTVLKRRTSILWLIWKALIYQQEIICSVATAITTMTGIISASQRCSMHPSGGGVPRARALFVKG
jgi:hypothetical protein